MKLSPSSAAAWALVELTGREGQQQIVHCALNHWQSAPPNVQRVTTDLFKKSLRLTGFRPGYLPPIKPYGLLEKAINFALTSKNPLVAQAVVQLWHLAQTDLEADLQSFEQTSEQENAAVFAEPDAQPPRWSENLQTLVTAFVAQYPRYPAEEAALMLVCLASSKNLDEAEIPTAGTEVSDVALAPGLIDERDLASDGFDALPENESGILAGTLWEQWLSTLAQLAPEAAEWRRVAEFVEAVQDLAATKSQEAQAAQEAQEAAAQRALLQQALDSLRQEMADTLTTLGLGECRQWQAATVDNQECAAWAAAISQWRATVTAYLALRLQPATLQTLAEEEAREESLKRLRTELRTGYNQLNAILALPPPDETPFPASESGPPTQAQTTNNLTPKTAIPRPQFDSTLSKKPNASSTDNPPSEFAQASLNLRPEPEAMPLAERAVITDLNAVTDPEPSVPALLDNPDTDPTDEASKANLVIAAPELEGYAYQPEEQTNKEPSIVAAAVSAAYAALSAEPGAEADTAAVSLLTTDGAALTPEPPPSAHPAALRLSSHSWRDPDALNKLLWQLLLENRLGLAWHLARGGEASAQAELPAALVRALVLGPQLRYANGTLAHLLKEDFATLATDTGSSDERAHSLRFLWAAAALRPALLAPDTGAAAVLQTLRFVGLENLFGYCKTIVDFANRQQVLEPANLKNVRDATAWQTELDNLIQEARAWQVHAPQMTMNYAPATAVWRKWQEPGQPIHSLLQPIRDNDTSQTSKLGQTIGELTDETLVRRKVNATCHSLRKRGEGIIATAFNQIRNHLREAVGFAQGWLELQEVRPGRQKTYAQQQIESLVTELRQRQPQVEAEGEAFARRHDSLTVRASWQLCRQTLTTLQALFQGQVAEDEPLPEHLLHADWLRHPSQLLDAQGQPEGEPASWLPNLLELVEATPDWGTAFAAHCEAKDHAATGRILSYLTAYPDATLDLAALRQQREEDLKACRENLCDEAKETERRVGRAIDVGLLREHEQVALAAEIEQIRRHADETVQFEQPRQQLAAIREALQSKRTQAAQPVRERLAQSGLADDHPAVERIRQVLEQGDAATANEYLDMALRKHPLPDGAAQPNIFQDFFPETFRQLMDFLQPRYGLRPDLNKILSSLDDFGHGRKHTLEIGPLNLKQVKGGQALQVAELLDAWFTAKRTNLQGFDQSMAQRILTQLGFNPNKLELSRQGQRIWLDFDCVPLNDRNLCPVPVYGSQANGHYRILCVWERPTEDDLARDMGDTAHGKPALVFYFGRITEARRQELAQLCREQRRTFIVLDDTLLWFLCAARSPRLSRLFECALPFTYTEPYTATASLVPVEMFYGRERERASIINPLGACFIYGGRQLGKTALLRDVQRRFHQPEQGQVALWFDINTHGICFNKDIDEIWGDLALELKALGVMPASASAQTNLDTLLKGIKAWLQQNDSRRLLLLLDEADRFLAVDGSKAQGPGAKGDFFRVARLKGLMDETQRCFKVVFAGLHDVQRTTRLANHALAHYGDSLCIGPLLNNGEQKEARALIEKPFAALGYVFESSDLVTRILWQTNYYPSLIQLYCEQLLKHLTEQYISHGRASLPYVITARHVEEAYSDQNLRKAIRQRFLLTLQLDPRYEIIAYLLAWYTLTEAARRSERGFLVEWIRQEAVAWWPEGFQGSNASEDIAVLLDEMVGLGILRVVGAGRYALRSANVTYLMGTEQEIEAALERPRETPVEYKPATFRAAWHTQQTREKLLSCLTAEQEAQLRRREHGATLIVGTPAADLLKLEPYLRTSFGPDFFRTCPAHSDLATFQKSLADLSQRAQDGVTLLLVPPTCAWDDTWLKAWKQKRFVSKTSFTHTVFVADPELAWTLVQQGQLPRLREAAVTRLTLRPWHDTPLRQWLDAHNWPSEPQHRQKITELTGNWPYLLREFYQRADVSGWQQGLAELAAGRAWPETRHHLEMAWGLTDPLARKLLAALAVLEEATTEELAEIIGEEVPCATVAARLAWADWLGLVQAAPDGKWQVEPTLARLLTAQEG